MPEVEEKQGWRQICQAASQEQDPSKLLELVRQLNDALSQAEAAKSPALMSDVDSAAV